MKTTLTKIILGNGKECGLPFPVKVDTDNNPDKTYFDIVIETLCDYIKDNTYQPIYLKLDKKYCDDVLSGKKTFEVRKNDRNYKVGSVIRFIPWDNEDEFSHPLRDKTYIITYILDNPCYCKKGYITFAIRPVAEWKEDGALYRCTHCGHTESYYDMSYCPVCGAMMK